MRLEVETLSMRGGYIEDTAWETKVIDADTGEEVGIVRHERSPAWRRISLFGGKYEAELSTNEECIAFAKGVQAVLNHMTSFERKISN